MGVLLPVVENINERYVGRVPPTGPTVADRAVAPVRAPAPPAGAVRGVAAPVGPAVGVAPTGPAVARGVAAPAGPAVVAAPAGPAVVAAPPSPPAPAFARGVAAPSGAPGRATAAEAPVRHGGPAPVTSSTRSGPVDGATALIQPPDVTAAIFVDGSGRRGRLLRRTVWTLVALALLLVVAFWIVQGLDAFGPTS
ncbi:hypothetical protein ACFO0M_20970 [Micromonospora mangrovi]|uniref:Serine/threonine protein kinase n=2 Tax=Micromonospora TaxID=1873 RepID=A0AAU8H8D8_9ACTN